MLEDSSRALGKRKFCVRDAASVGRTGVVAISGDVPALLRRRYSPAPIRKPRASVHRRKQPDSPTAGQLARARKSS